MKMLSTALWALLIIGTSAQAGVIVGGTRLIYDGGKKETSLSISNPDKTPYLIQSWIETTDGAKKAPFIVTPPLFRLSGDGRNTLRVVRAGGDLPSDKETLFWMNIKSIPGEEKVVDTNTLQIAVKTRIKMIYRPQEVKGDLDEAASTVTWQRRGNQLQVTNPTPFFMNFQAVTVAGRTLDDITYVAPKSTTSFTLPNESIGNSISWSIINDYGGIGKTHTGKL